jgi:hypothetical protein
MDTKRSRARLPIVQQSLRPPTPHELELREIASEGQRERRLRAAEWSRTRTPWLADGEDGLTG